MSKTTECNDKISKIPVKSNKKQKSPGSFDKAKQPKLFFIKTEQIRKPGSVLNDTIIIYLGLLSPKGSRDLTRKLDGPPNTFLCGLAPDGVYLAGLLPNRRCALTAPFHPYLRKGGGLFLWHYP